MLKDHTLFCQLVVEFLILLACHVIIFSINIFTISLLRLLNFWWLVTMSYFVSVYLIIKSLLITDVKFEFLYINAYS